MHKLIYIKNPIMKTIKGVLFIVVLVFLSACEGEPGPPGRDGLDGESFLGSVFEIQGDFTSENEFSLYFQFPPSLTIYESDVVLVYILWQQVENDNGEFLDVWRLLPQSVVLEEGILQYNYDYTFQDVEIFLEGTIDFSTLRVSEAIDQVFRIVVLPADYNLSAQQELSDYNLFMKSLGVNPEVIK